MSEFTAPTITREMLVELQQLRTEADSRGDYTLGWAIDLAITFALGGGDALVNDAVTRLKSQMRAVPEPRA